MIIKKAEHGGKGNRLKRLGINIIDFSASLNPVPPEIDLSPPLEAIRYYPDDEYPLLKQVIAEHHHRDPEEITVGNGSADIIRTLCHTLLSPGKTACIQPHTFSEYALSARLAGAEINSDPHTADLTFFCNPNNPSGILTPGSIIIDTLNQSVKNGGVLCIDEAFIDLADPEQSVSHYKDPRLFVLRSLTKSFAFPGIRFGYGIGDPDLIQALETMRSPWAIGAFSESVAIQAFKKYQELDFSRQYITAERIRMTERITELGFSCSQASANYIMIETGMSASNLTEKMLEKGILVRDCTSFGLNQNIRIAIRTHEENTILLEALSTCMP